MHYYNFLFCILIRVKRWNIDMKTRKSEKYDNAKSTKAPNINAKSGIKISTLRVLSSFCCVTISGCLFNILNSLTCKTKSLNRKQKKSKWQLSASIIKLQLGHFIFNFIALLLWYWNFIITETDIIFTIFICYMTVLLFTVFILWSTRTTRWKPTMTYFRREYPVIQYSTNDSPYQVSYPI